MRLSTDYACATVSFYRFNASATYCPGTEPVPAGGLGGAHVQTVLIHELVRGLESQRSAVCEQRLRLRDHLSLLRGRHDRACPSTASALSWQRHAIDCRQRLGHHVHLTASGIDGGG